MSVTIETGITTRRGRRAINEDGFFHYAQLLEIPCIDQYEVLVEHSIAVRNEWIIGLRQGLSSNPLLKGARVRRLMEAFPVIYGELERILASLVRKPDDSQRLSALVEFLRECADVPIYVRLYGIPIKSQLLDSIGSAIKAYETIREEGSREFFTAVFQQLDEEVSKFRNEVVKTPEMSLRLAALKSALSRRGRLFAVSDGVSGAQEGHLAAQISTRLLRNYYKAGEHVTSGLSCGDILVKTIDDIDRQLAQLDIGTATALTAVLVEKGEANDLRCQAFWVGDVEAYRIDENEIELLTGGHGELSPEQANANPLRYLGTRYGVCVHKGKRAKLQAGDWIVIASDGVTRCLSREAIAGIVRSASSQEASRQMVEEASRKGSEDNLTAMVIRIGNAPEA